MPFCVLRGMTAIYIKWHFSVKTKWVNFLARENFLSNHNSWFFFLIQSLKLGGKTPKLKKMDLIETTVILNVLAILGILSIFGQWEMELSMAQGIPAFVLLLSLEVLFILNPLAAILVLMRWKFQIYLLKNLFVAYMHSFYKNKLWNID